MIKVLTKNFFERSTLTVAKDLLGKYLVRRASGKMARFMITEVEAYDGFKDRASHAARGLTKRNAPMFGKAGHWYVYFTYGMHYMLNIVTGPKNYPAAILIRGVAALQLRGESRPDGRDGISGPARITKKLKIDKKFNDKIASPKTGLWIEDNQKFRSSKFKIRNYPRIGVSYAGPIWSKKKWRFIIDKKI